MIVDTRPWGRLLGSGRRVLALGSVLLVGSVLMVSALLLELRREALAGAQQNAARLGVAVAEQTRQAVQSADLLLQGILQEIRAKRLDTPEAFRAELGTQDVQRSLMLRRAGLRQVDALSVVDADGRLLNFTRQWPVPALDLADRDYFRHFKAGGTAAPFVSEAVVSRGGGQRTFFLARRVSNAAGQMLGLALVGLDLDYFQAFYRNLGAGALDMQLSRADGRLLTRFPPTSEEQSADGPRIRFVQELSQYGLVVSIAESEWAVLADWRRTAGFTMALTTAALLFVFVLLRAASRQFTRLERSETSLEERNTALEATRRRMELQTQELTIGRESLAEKSAALEAALAHMNQGILMVAADHTVAIYNQRALDMLELPPELVASRPKFEALAAWQRQAGEFDKLESNPASTIGKGAVLSERQVYERTRPNGTVLEIQTIPMADGGMVRTYTDITQRRASEEQIRYYAHHDSLTRLGNRVVFKERLDHAVQLALRSGLRIAVFYLDLDGFKLVNDSYGHQTGDTLLVEVADRLRSVVRTIDTVARMGGDEFAVIQGLVEQVSDAERLAERIQEAVRAPYEVGGIQCLVDVSIGIALFPDHSADADDLLRDADIALYRAKGSGKGMFCLFDAAVDRRQQQMFLMEQDLRHALSRNEFTLDYQPMVDLTTMRTVRFEALLRWRHPVAGLVAPGDFIGLAEKSGLIVSIGAWVLETACAQTVAWPEEIEISVNLSPAQFSHGDLPAMVAGVLERTGLAARRLHLEVTEGLLLDDSTVVLSSMERLRASGVRFSLDDFGTAHAGLSYLRRFPFDAIKIDRSFVRDAPGQKEARALVAAMMAMGMAFGLTVVAEGVETEAQLALMRELGCSLVQGYLLGRPVPPERAMAPSAWGRALAG